MLNRDCIKTQDLLDYYRFLQERVEEQNNLQCNYLDAFQWHEISKKCRRTKLVPFQRVFLVVVATSGGRRSVSNHKVYNNE